MTLIKDGWSLDYELDGISLEKYNDLRQTFAIAGEYVAYTGKNGYDVSREYAENYMVVGQIFRVKSCSLGSSDSVYQFVELPGKFFNTVMFAKVFVDGTKINNL